MSQNGGEDENDCVAESSAFSNNRCSRDSSGSASSVCDCSRSNSIREEESELSGKVRTFQLQALRTRTSLRRAASAGRRLRALTGRRRTEFNSDERKSPPATLRTILPRSVGSLAAICAQRSRRSCSRVKSLLSDELFQNGQPHFGVPVKAGDKTADVPDEDHDNRHSEDGGRTESGDLENEIAFRQKPQTGGKARRQHDELHSVGHARRVGVSHATRETPNTTATRHSTPISAASIMNSGTFSRKNGTTCRPTAQTTPSTNSSVTIERTGRSLSKSAVPALLFLVAHHADLFMQ